MSALCRAPFQEPLPRPPFLSPLAVAAALAASPSPFVLPPPALRIRLPPLKIWTCDGCHCVYPDDVEDCDECSGDEEEEEEEGGGDPWYCRYCEDFCSNGRGICRQCEREGVAV